MTTTFILGSQALVDSLNTGPITINGKTVRNADSTQVKASDLIVGRSYEIDDNGTLLLGPVLGTAS